MSLGACPLLLLLYRRVLLACTTLIILALSGMAVRGPDYFHPVTGIWQEIPEKVDCKSELRVGRPLAGQVEVMLEEELTVAGTNTVRLRGELAGNRTLALRGDWHEGSLTLAQDSVLSGDLSGRFGVEEMAWSCIGYGRRWQKLAPPGLVGVVTRHPDRPRQSRTRS